MKFMLDAGFNVCVYGVGTKRAFLYKLYESTLSEGGSNPACIVNGYHTASNIKLILNKICQFVQVKLIEERMDNLIKKKFASVFEQIDYLEKLFKLLPFQFYLIIHSLDSANLRNDEFQRFLSKISSIENVIFIL
jgi:hypothetical protein